MNKLQKLAIKRIRNLAEEIEVSQTAYLHNRTLSDEVCKKIDQENSAKWLRSDRAKEQIIEWATALMEVD